MLDPPLLPPPAPFVLALAELAPSVVLVPSVVLAPTVVLVPSLPSATPPPEPPTPASDVPPLSESSHPNSASPRTPSTSVRMASHCTRPVTGVAREHSRPSLFYDG